MQTFSIVCAGFKKKKKRKKGRVEETSLREERRGEDCHRRSIVSLRRDANVIYRPGYIDIQIYDPSHGSAQGRNLHSN